MTNDLARYDAMCRAIEEAHSIDEVMLIKDKARAIEAAAKIARNVETETKSRIIRFRAERRLGELVEPFVSPGGHPRKTKGKGIRALSKQINIPKNTLKIYRLMNEIPIDEFEKRIREKQSSIGVLGYKNRFELNNTSTETIKNSRRQSKFLLQLKQTFANSPKATQLNFIRWLLNEGYISHEILDIIYDGTHDKYEHSECANA